MKTDFPLLLDTHVWIWLAHGDSRRIRPLALRAIEDAGSRKAIRISVISVWEIAMLENKKRITLSTPCLDWIERAIKLSGIQLLPLTANICVDSCNLPNSR